MTDIKNIKLLSNLPNLNSRVRKSIKNNKTN